MANRVPTDKLTVVFLAGMIQARGRVYIGSLKQAPGSGLATRWNPSLSLEISGNPDGHWPYLTELFGEPHERRYYGKPSWRYVTQDKAKIAEILGAVQPILFGDVQQTASAMIAFCKAQSAKSQEEHATRVQQLAKR